MINLPEEQVLELLEDVGAWVYHRAATGSVYIKFADTRLCSLRIADHAGRRQYRYKWNLLTEGLISHQSWDGNVLRRYYIMEDVNKMVADIKKEQEILNGD